MKDSSRHHKRVWHTIALAREGVSCVCVLGAAMELLALLFSLLLLPTVFALLLWRRSHTAREEVASTGVAAAASRAAETRASTRSRMRRRHTSVAPAVSSSASGVGDDEAEEEEEEDEEEEVDGYYVSKKPGKKDLKKKEKEARREAEKAAREAKSEKQDRYEAMRRKKDAEREEEERRKEEAAREQKAREEQAANEEFEKWKSHIVVDTEGTLEDTEKQTQGLLVDFVEYIKKHKCVALEDLAAEFNLRTQECINRVMELEQMGRISGVMDDRGKFIYISPEEMKAVADYIKRLGRVSIAHLASKSNEFIDLEPKILETDIISCAEEVGEPSKIDSVARPIPVA